MEIWSKAPRKSKHEMSDKNPTRPSACTELHLTRPVYELHMSHVVPIRRGDVQEHQHEHFLPCTLCACQNLEAQGPNRVRRAYTSPILTPWHLYSRWIGDEMER
jgi:hypothetical protein